MRRRTTEESKHRSTLIITIQTAEEHRPALPTTHRSTMESTTQYKEIIQLAVVQMITIMRAMQ